MTFLDQKSLARRWSISHRTLEAWRHQQRGPQYVRIGGRVRYRMTDVEAFEAARLHTNTVGPLPTTKASGEADHA